MVQRSMNRPSRPPSRKPAPESVGALTRSVFESLAIKYRCVLRQILEATGKTIEVLHIVGGGSRNSMVCQMAADATGYPVIAGPVEATALGNAIAQLVALGDLKSMEEGRALVRESFPVSVYQPGDPVPWDAAEPRFKELIKHA